MSMALRQQQLADYIRHQSQQLPSGLDTSLPQMERRLAVYRNNHFFLLSQALADTFAVTHSLLGPNNFSALAGAFVQQHPPQSPVLSRWGGGFPNWLESQNLPAKTQWVAEVARFEWAWLEVSLASVTESPVRDWQGYSQQQLLQSRFSLLPSCRLLSAGVPVRQIWLAHQRTDNSPDLQSIDMQRREQLLLLGQSDRVKHWTVAPALFSLLEGIEQGKTLGEALECCLPLTDQPGLAAAMAFVFANGLLAEPEDNSCN